MCGNNGKKKANQAFSLKVQFIYVVPTFVRSSFYGCPPPPGGSTNCLQNKMNFYSPKHLATLSARTLLFVF